MNTIDAIKSRRSIRTFNETTIADETVRDIVAVSSYAPSWKNSQTTRYILVKDSALKDNIANNGVMGSAHNKGIIDSAPAIMVIATKSKRSGYERDGSFSTSKGTHFESFDAGLATEAFVLAAHEYGVATVILGIIDEESIKKILDIGDELKVSALVAMGYSDSTPNAPQRKSVDELLDIR